VDHIQCLSKYTIRSTFQINPEHFMGRIEKMSICNCGNGVPMVPHVEILHKPLLQFYLSQQRENLH
jgi:hypothetical protein